MGAIAPPVSKKLQFLNEHGNRIIVFVLPLTGFPLSHGRQHRGTGGGMPPLPSPLPPPSPHTHTHTHTFLSSKKKKWKQRRKKRVWKQKLLKGCHQGKNVTVLAAIECLEFKNFPLGQPWWPTILSSVPWLLYFEVHVAGLFLLETLWIPSKGLLR